MKPFVPVVHRNNPTPYPLPPPESVPLPCNPLAYILVSQLSSDPLPLTSISIQGKRESRITCVRVDARADLDCLSKSWTLSLLPPGSHPYTARGRESSGTGLRWIQFRSGWLKQPFNFTPQKQMDTYLESCFDAIGIFLCIHIVHRYRILMHKRSVPALDK